MSKNDAQLREFTVLLSFTRTGEVESVSYGCLEEYDCGSHPVDLGGYVDDLVSMHLNHMRDAHEVRPVRQCGYQIVLPSGEVLLCCRGPHGVDAKHLLEA